MPSPRETSNSNSFEPLNPNFPRQASTGQASLQKYSTVDEQYADISQQPTRVAGAGVTVIMDVPLTLRRQRVLLSNAVLTLTAANDFASLKLVDLPDRNIVIFQAELFGTVLTGGDFATGDDPVVGVGQAAASTNPIDTTQVDVIPATTYTNIVAATLTAVSQSRLGATGDLNGILIPDAPGSALYLNASNPDTQLAADGTLTFNGFFDFWYVDLGNVSS